MIVATFLPSGEKSPLPGGLEIYAFFNFDEFKRWVQDYVCVNCLVDFKELMGKDPSTIEDWLEMGCGCELDLEYDEGDIDWEAKMTLPAEYFEYFERIENESTKTG